MNTFSHLIPFNANLIDRGMRAQGDYFFPDLAAEAIEKARCDSLCKALAAVHRARMIESTGTNPN